MSDILVRVIVVAALLQLGLDFSSIGSGLPLATSKVLKIDWKPISLFPKEARRFLPQSK